MDEKRIKKLDELFEAFSIIAEGAYVYLCDMKYNYSRWSETAVDFFGLPDKYMYGAGDIWLNHIHPDDRENYSKSIEEIFAGTASGHDMQYRAMSADGSYTICTCRGVIIHDENGSPKYFGGIIRNHGAHSYIDSVTGLRSLYGFFDDLKTTIRKCQQNVMLLIGLSSFSDINDVYGYTFGNKVLYELGRQIQISFVNCGAVYKLDGTKFAIVSHDVSYEYLVSIFNKMKNDIIREFYVDGEKVNLSLNMGAVVLNSCEIGAETVYSCLKYAYYESKHHHLGEPFLFDNALSHENRTNLHKLNTIRNSIPNRCSGFFLCYQPIVNAETEELKAIEALLRWKNDEYGIVPPNEFISVLEQDTLFPELGRWILKQAMTDCKLFLEKYPGMLVNVNLSYAQLESANFVADVLKIIRETDFPPGNLCLEITERCRLLDMSLLRSIIDIFRANGIKVALDDFGTGFSSLGVLRSLPIDSVKIDREFIKNIEKSNSDQYTVQFISDLAHAFSAEVCAEGVETAEMRDYLRNYRISGFQGYYYSRPVTIDVLFDKIN
ncbi:MAG: EAL domain-containing protein [Ruminococcus sp.]|nr:EAL domain-containing protein [Ruminococcus sp.]